MKKRYRNMQKKANGKVREIGNGSVLLELLEDMARRGLNIGRDYLFVLDGSKGP